MNSNENVRPTTPGEPSARSHGNSYFTVVTLALVGTAILITLLLPAMRSGVSPTRAQCDNNLRNIGFALHAYDSVYHSLPPAHTVDAQGKPLHSWRTLILPYLEQKPLYDKIDLSKPWNDPANRAAYETVVSVYSCPSMDCPENHTAYFAVVGSHGCFRATRPRKFSEIIDRHDMTLMVVELGSKQAVHWMSPMDASVQSILDLATVETPHPGGFQAAYVDGGTRFVLSKTKPARLRALLTIDGDDDDVVGSND